LNTVKFFSLVALYFATVWAALAYIPAISVAARVPMTWQLWLCVAAGFFFGTYLSSAFVFMFLGARPLPYGRWDCSRERQIKTPLGHLIIVLVMTAVGIFAANMAVEWGLRHM
jgi:hypothetical protein